MSATPTGPLTTSPDNGRPLELRDSRLASQTFRMNADSWNGVPKSKFLFYIRFMRSGGTGGTGGTTAVDWSKGVGLTVKTVDRPKVGFETQTLNQYNKKRVVQSKVEYAPLTIRFHDTVDSKVFNMFEEYFRFYYGDPRAPADTAWNWDIAAAQMQGTGSGRWGFNPPQVSAPNDSYFFSSIEIYQLYAGKYSQFDIVNPKIVSFDPDEMDYTNGGATHEITMTLAFEGILYKGNNKDLSSDLLSEMGLDKAGFYLPSNSGSGISTPSYNGGQTYTPSIQGTADTNNVLGSLNPTGTAPTTLPQIGNTVGANPLQGVLGGLPLFASDFSNISNPFPTDARVLNSGIIAPADTLANSALRFMGGLI